MTHGLFLGVDGGGSGCRARLTDAAGRILGEGAGGAANLTLGVETAAASVRTAADAAFLSAGLPLSLQSDLRAGLGLAGANVPMLAVQARRAVWPFAAVTVASDAVAACLGAHGGGDGAILILGTGSQGLALVGGREITVGGWGFHLSDGGSGAALGRAALRAALLAFEDLAPRSALTAALMARFYDDPAAAALWAASAGPGDYAAFAPQVAAEAEARDPVATALMQASAAEAAALLDRLVELGAERIALMGGFAAPQRRWLPDRLGPVLVEPRGDALDGALALARTEARP